MTREVPWDSVEIWYPPFQREKRFYRIPRNVIVHEMVIVELVGHYTKTDLSETTLWGVINHKHIFVNILVPSDSNTLLEVDQ